jgi:hypothetical protein
MSDELPDSDDIEVVQMMAAQSVVMEHHDELHTEYLHEIREKCERYGVEVPSKVERELQEQA